MNNPDYFNPKLHVGSFIEPLANLFDDLGVAQIYDAAPSYCNVINVPFLSRTIRRKLCGPIFPVHTYNDMLPGLQALAACPKNWVVFIKNCSEKSEALVGDIFVSAAIGQSINGLVIDGAIRDIDFINGFNIPVFSSEVTFVSAKTAREPARKIPEMLVYNHIQINAGDFLFADSDGMLTVKPTHLSAVIAGAKGLRQMEKKLIESLDAGYLLSEEIGLDSFLRGEAPLKVEI